MTEADHPYTVKRGFAERDGHILTHVEWHPCHMGIDIAQYESGLRTSSGDFCLIQHGWRDFKAVERIVWQALDKGWSADRIEDFLRSLANRKQRATVL